MLTEPNSIQNFEINQTKNSYDPNEIQQIVEAAENFEAENQVSNNIIIFNHILIFFRNCY